MAGDVREGIDPELDLKMEQNGAPKRFFVVVFFFLLFPIFIFYLSHKLRLFGGKEGLPSLPSPFATKTISAPADPGKTQIAACASASGACWADEDRVILAVNSCV